MPIYEYKCENDHVFEVIQPITDEPLDKCQECGAPAARVLYSPAVHFKGSGFYNTDYGRKKGGGGNGSAAEASSSESKSSSSEGSGSSDSGASGSDSSSKSSSKAGSATD